MGRGREALQAYEKAKKQEEAEREIERELLERETIKKKLREEGKVA
ncbi:hypothetical protein HYX13_00245 [Candidatus Woesearchaeota archaeon]|nr:hypothetical protein [Candidatus Woesearchaeota archaeon]